jgi:CBS domain-containing protein
MGEPIMTRLTDLIHDAKPISLRPAVTVKRACEEMRKNGASAVLVTDPDGDLVGIFTGRDAICRVLADSKNPAKVTLAQVMTKMPKTISRYATAVEALRLMWDGGFRHLPVTEKGKAVGLVRRRDFRSEDLNYLEAERNFWEHMR